MYKELAAIYKGFEAEVEALAKCINAKVHEGDYMIAVGLPYGKVGDRVLVTFDNEESIYCIIGDSKGDRYYHDCSKGACVVEFIVDTQELNSKAKNMGDCSYIEGLEGEVKTITTLPSYEEIVEFWKSKPGFLEGKTR